MKAGSSATREMPFTAHPHPDVSLTYNDGDVHDEERIKPKMVDSKIIFEISDAERADAGDYKMTLTNEFGTATMLIKVTVLGRYILSAWPRVTGQ